MLCDPLSFSALAAFLKFGVFGGDSSLNSSNQISWIDVEFKSN